MDVSFKYCQTLIPENNTSEFECRKWRVCLQIFWCNFFLRVQIILCVVVFAFLLDAEKINLLQLYSLWRDFLAQNLNLHREGDSGTSVYLRVYAD